MLLLRITVDKDEVDKGAVITFDDITDLQSAQRKAAWSDVARRIAHEIKNPLTPIQLSAERLKRKYLKIVPESEQSVFTQCIDTIVRHVGDIGHMVNEFSNFARMPEPIMRSIDLRPVVREIVTLQQEAHAGIEFTFLEDPKLSPRMIADEQQIRQALVNIVQNAVDSVSQKWAGGGGKIIVAMAQGSDGTMIIAIQDNGLGLPKGRDPMSLTEPYVTLREKGTGLGLAIVKKIMEDHKGGVVFSASDAVRALDGWHDLGGATVAMVLPAGSEASLKS